MHKAGLCLIFLVLSAHTAQGLIRFPKISSRVDNSDGFWKSTTIDEVVAAVKRFDAQATAHETRSEREDDHVLAQSSAAYTLTHVTRMASGLTLVTQEDHSNPVASVFVWYRVGSHNEVPSTNGISHLLEHLLFKGTELRPVQFGRLFSLLGSRSNAFTNYDETVYHNFVESDKIGHVLTLEADRMLNALLTDEMLESEKTVVSSELGMYENDVANKLRRAVLKKTFGPQSYGLPIGGEMHDVMHLTGDQVFGFYEKHYTPANCTVILVGDFTTLEAIYGTAAIFNTTVTQSSSSLVINPVTAPDYFLPWWFMLSPFWFFGLMFPEWSILFSTGMFPPLPLPFGKLPSQMSNSEPSHPDTLIFSKISSSTPSGILQQQQQQQQQSDVLSNTAIGNGNDEFSDFTSRALDSTPASVLEDLRPIKAGEELSDDEHQGVENVLSLSLLEVANDVRQHAKGKKQSSHVTKKTTSSSPATKSASGKAPIPNLGWMLADADEDSRDHVTEAAKPGLRRELSAHSSTNANTNATASFDDSTLYAHGQKPGYHTAAFNKWIQSSIQSSFLETDSSEPGDVAADASTSHMGRINLAGTGVAELANSSLGANASFVLSSSPRIVSQDIAAQFPVMQITFPMTQLTFADPRRPALHLLDQIIAGGKLSSLSLTLLAAGVACEAVTELSVQRDASWYTITLQAESLNDLELAANLTTQMLATLRQTPVKAGRLSMAKSNIVLQLLRNQESSIEQVGETLGRDFVTSGSVQFTSHYISDIQHTTADQVRDVAYALLQSGTAIIGVVLPQNTSESSSATAPPHVTLHASRQVSSATSCLFTSDAESVELVQLGAASGGYSFRQGELLMESFGRQQTPSTPTTQHTTSATATTHATNNEQQPHHHTSSSSSTAAAHASSLLVAPVKLQLSSEISSEISAASGMASEAGSGMLSEAGSGQSEPSIPTAQQYQQDAHRLFGLVPPLPPMTKYIPAPLLMGMRDVTLPNGLRVLLVPQTASNFIQMNVRIQSGTMYDSSGVASVTATTLLRGCGEYSAADLAVSIEGDGSQLSVIAGREFTQVVGASLVNNFEKLLLITAHCLTNATFQQSQISLAVSRVTDSLDETHLSPEDRARQILRKLTFPPGHPFHASPSPASIAGVTRDDVLRFYRQYYQPRLATVMLTGGFDPEYVLTLIQKYLAGWTSTNPLPKLNIPDVVLNNTSLNPYTPPSEDVVIPGTVEGITLLGHVGVSQCDRDYSASIVANAILGGDTLSSRLGRYIRDSRGLTYGINSQFEAGVSGGSFVIRMQAKMDVMAAAIKAAWNVLYQLVMDGVSDDEVEIAKRTVLGHHTLTLSDPVALGRLAMTQYLCGNPAPITSVALVREQIINASTAAVNRVLRTYIDPWGLVRVTVGPQQVDLSDWQRPPRHFFSPIVPVSEIGGVVRSVVYENGTATIFSVRDLWLNTYGVSSNKLSATVSWAAPVNETVVTSYKLWWATDCSKTGIMRASGPVWLDIFKDANHNANFRYQQALNQVDVPVGAVFILVASSDAFGNPWPTFVCVRVNGN